MKITKIQAREVFNSRSNPTVEPEVMINYTAFASAIHLEQVPAKRKQLNCS
jgi:enolase